MVILISLREHLAVNSNIYCLFHSFRIDKKSRRQAIAISQFPKMYEYLIISPSLLLFLLIV